MLSQDKQQIAKRLASDTEKQLKKKMQKNRSSIFAINLSKDLHQNMDSLVSFVKDKGANFACQKGCGHCCNLRVDALASEVFYIAKQLKRRLDKSELQALTDKLAAFSEQAKGLSRDQHKISCPMLKDGSCSIYDLRPLMCRKFNSLDLNACLSQSDVPENQELAVKAGAMLYGINQAYSKQKLSVMPHEFNQSLYLALTQPELEKRWAKGQIVFPVSPELQ